MLLSSILSSRDLRALTLMSDDDEYFPDEFVDDDDDGDAIVPRGFAKWAWLSDEVVTLVIALASVEVVVALSTLEARCRHLCEPYIERIVRLTRPPFSLGRDVLTGRNSRIQISGVLSDLELESLASAITHARLLGHASSLHLQSSASLSPFIHSIGSAMPGLRELSFGGYVSKEDLAALSHINDVAGVLPALERLDLSGCGVTPLSFGDLARLCNSLPQLKQLDLLANCAIPKAARVDLSSQIPTVKVRWDSSEGVQ